MTKLLERVTRESEKHALMVNKDKTLIERCHFQKQTYCPNFLTKSIAKVAVTKEIWQKTALAKDDLAM